MVVLGGPLTGKYRAMREPVHGFFVILRNTGPTIGVGIPNLGLYYMQHSQRVCSFAIAVPPLPTLKAAAAESS